jgi:UDP-GlcNAc:undecaprenyl-phosphate GlcNAc-1-phosphate transferase
VTPLLGGLAVYIAFVIGIVALFLLTDLGKQSSSNINFGIALLISGALFCGLGLWDDWSPLRARYKFLLQIAATIPFVALGPTIETLHFLGTRIDLGPMAVPFTIFWIVSCVNIVNLIDGMDGLATSVGLIASATLAVLSLSLNQSGLAAIGFVFVACLLGFLLHNWPPAKIFLGDAGSLTIGFVVGALSTGAALKTATGFVLILPTVLLGVPILDTALAIIRRKLMGHGIGDADRGHIHHRLQERGLSKAQALLVIVGFCLTMAVVVIIAGRMKSDWFALAVGGAVILAMFLGRILGFHEVNLAIRSLRILLRVAQIAITGLRARMSFMRFETAGSLDPEVLWELVETYAESVGGTRVELTFEGEDSGTRSTARQWTRTESVVLEGASWDIRYSVPRGDGLRVALLATGCCGEDVKEQKLEYLIQLCSQVCRSWPMEGPSILSLQEHLNTVKAAPELELVAGQRAA